MSRASPRPRCSTRRSIDDQVTGIDGNGVDSDLTNAEIAENGLLYQDLTQIAAAREGILQTAMNTTTVSMSFFDALNISASGLTAERTQMDVTAENLANAQSTNNGTPYKPQAVELQSVGSGSSFQAELSSAHGRRRLAPPAASRSPASSRRTSQTSSSTTRVTRRRTSRATSVSPTFSRSRR